MGKGLSCLEASLLTSQAFLLSLVYVGSLLAFLSLKVLASFMETHLQVASLAFPVVLSSVSLCLSILCLEMGSFIEPGVPPSANKQVPGTLRLQLLSTEIIDTRLDFLRGHWGSELGSSHSG